MWALEAGDATPENLDQQVVELLSKLSADLAVWRALSQRFAIDLYCGLFMEHSNEGAEISAATLKALGERGIALGLEIYGPTQE